MDANFSERLAQETLKRTTGSILIDAGFHKAKPGALNILSDILKKYLEKLYKTTVNFAQHGTLLRTKMSTKKFSHPILRYFFNCLFSRP